MINAMVYIKGITKGKYGAVSAVVCDSWGRVLNKTSMFVGETTPIQVDFTALLSGVELAVAHLIIGLLFCITIVGIPFGKQHFKLAQVALLPFGTYTF